MRIQNIHIDNFGKISNFDMDFSKNTTVIMQENGWGKSTLASFIKVMFYGFEGENKKSIRDREREHFRPWNKGIYGGSILFEHNEKEYELTRHFGAKERDDSIQLVNITTNLGTNDFNAANLGNDILGIDMESFSRTLFIGQGNIGVHNEKDSIGDGILAKAGKLTEAADDIGDYESVSSRLRDAMRSLKSGNKFGRINELLSERSFLESNVKGESAVNESIALEKSRLNLLEKEKEIISKKEAKLEEELVIAGRAKEYDSYENRIRDIKADIEEKKKTAAQYRNSFGKRIPTREEIRTAEENADFLSKCINEIRVLEGEAENVSVMPGIDEGLLEEQTKNVDRYEELSHRIYGEKIRLENAEGKLEDALRKAETKEKLYENELKIYGEKKETEKKKATVATIVLGVLGALLVITGVLMLSYSFGPLLICAGVMFAVAALPVGRLIKHRFEKEYEEPFMEKDNDTEICRSEVENLRQGYDMLYREKRILERNILDFLERIGKPGEITEIRKILAGLEQKNDISSQFEQRREKIEAKKAEAAGIKEKLIFWLEDLGAKPGEDVTAAVKGISKEFDLYTQAEGYYEEAKSKLDSEKNKYSDEEILLLKQARSMEEILGNKRVLAGEKQRKEEEIQHLSKAMNENLEKRDEIATSLESLEEVNTKLSQFEYKYDIISRTADYIDKAKEKLNTSYMNPIVEAFRKHYGCILTEGAEQYDVDANISISRKEMGEKRSLDSLSQGYRDLIDFSLRLALIDVMYGDEQVFIVLDDPFVNLDSEKMKKAVELIQSPSDNRQIIYFTCHESRNA